MCACMCVCVCVCVCVSSCCFSRNPEDVKSAHLGYMGSVHRESFRDTHSSEPLEDKGSCYCPQKQSQVMTHSLCFWSLVYVVTSVGGNTLQLTHAM